MLKKIIINTTALLLCCEINATPPPYVAATTNQQLVADQLESIVDPSPSQKVLLDLLNPLDEAATYKILNQLSGEQYTSLFLSTEIANRQFIRRLYDPLRMQIANPNSYTDEVYDICSSDGIDAWAEGSGGRSFLNGNKNAGGFKMSGYEVSAGAQKRLTPCWTLGFAGCYSLNHFHYNIGGDAKSNTVIGAAYTLYRPAHYYLLANITVGGATNDMHRRVKFNEEKDFVIKSRPNLSQVAFYGEAGVDWDCNCVLVQPFIGFEADQFKRNCKYDHGDDAMCLIYSGKKVTQVYSRLGVHLTTPENCYDIVCAFDLAWQYRLTSSRNDLSVRFADFGSSFTLTGIPDERNSLGMGFTVWSEFLEGWTLYLEATGERWKRVSSYAFTGGLIFKW